MKDVWAVGGAYEAYVGRWSRQVAAEFVRRIGLPAGLDWLDVGCGTGAVTAAVLSGAELRSVVGAAGLGDVSVEAIEVPTVFAGFDDYWTPFLGGQGSAPTYVATLPKDRQDALRERLRSGVPAEPDGTIRLTARAWSVGG